MLINSVVWGDAFLVRGNVKKGKVLQWFVVLQSFMIYKNSGYFTSFKSQWSHAKALVQDKERYWTLDMVWIFVMVVMFGQL